MLYIDYPSWISPEIIPGFKYLRWYPIGYIIATIITHNLLKRLINNEKPLNQKHEYFLKHFSTKKNMNIEEMFFTAIFYLIIFARLFSILIYEKSDIYLTQPWMIIWPFDNNFNFVGIQGMSYHGGVIGVIIGLIIYTKKNKLDFFDIGDKLAYCFPLGYTFGRLGNFTNAELYGRITDSPIGMLFKAAQKVPTTDKGVIEVAQNTGFLTEEVFINLPRYPSQLFEAFFEGIVLWLFMWFVIRKIKGFKGLGVASYAMGYAIIRFFIEYFRQPDVELGYILDFSNIKDISIYKFESMLAFSMGQILCFIMFLMGLSIFVIMYKKRGKNG